MKAPQRNGSRTGARKYKRSLEHLGVTGSKKKLKKTSTQAKPTHNGGAPERHRANSKTRGSQSWNNSSNKIVKVVLDYNPKHKTNTHEFISF